MSHETAAGILFLALEFFKSAAHNPQIQCRPINFNGTSKSIDSFSYFIRYKNLHLPKRPSLQMLAEAGINLLVQIDNT